MTDEELLKNPNVRKYFDIISRSEGTYGIGDNGYNVAFGGKTFDSYDAHPNIRTPFKQADGTTNYTSAAGKFQILKSTYDDIAPKKGITGFSPPEQEVIALEMARRDKSLPAILQGEFDTAMQLGGKTYASFNSSQYNQGKNSTERQRKILQESGVAPMPNAIADLPPAQASVTPGAQGKTPVAQGNTPVAPVAPANAVALEGHTFIPESRQEANALNFAKSQPPAFQESMINLMALVQANTLREQQDAKSELAPDFAVNYFKTLLQKV